MNNFHTEIPYILNTAIICFKFWVKLETSLLLIYFIPLTADKDTNGDTGSKYIFVDKSPEFSYEELANATDNFSLANKIGQGGFGEVYYGALRGQVCNCNHHMVSFNLHWSFETKF
jgi:hypothetical protein